MTNLYVENEGDMEHAIDYTVKIASLDVASKHISISFPTAMLLTVFMQNLLDEFEIQAVPKDCNLDIDLQIARSIDE